MKLAVPYYQQQDSCSCVPTVLSMVLDYHKIAHAKLAQILKTDKHGTPLRNAWAFMRSKGFRVSRIGIKETVKQIDQGNPVHVSYMDDTNDWHTSLIVGYRKKCNTLIFELNDPFYGQIELGSGMLKLMKCTYNKIEPNPKLG